MASACVAPTASAPQPAIGRCKSACACSPAGSSPTYVADELAVGDTLRVMPPTGRFHANLDATNEKFYLGVAAGSGITPMLSIIASILQAEPRSRCVLFYGNRKQSTTMFIDDLYALKNRYMERLQLHFVFSREDQEFPVAAGRIDADKVRELVGRFCAGATIDEAFVCGPDTMIAATQQALLDCGLSEQQVHSERFGVAATRHGGARRKSCRGGTDGAGQSSVTVIMDGHKKTFVMSASGASIVDAAAAHGIELPYSCKGGVCATCRTHVREGEVDMANNYGLEPWEVEQGFVLACQSQPQSDKLTLDYDKS